MAGQLYGVGGNAQRPSEAIDALGLQHLDFLLILVDGYSVTSLALR
jgi:hypothetical protein